MFDGYHNGPTTKNVAHLQRSGGGMGAQVNFTCDVMISSKKEHFLADTTNKKTFLLMLGEYLRKDGCTILHADGDAVLSATHAPTTLIGEDTDLLVLLCFHARDSSFPLYFKSDKKSSAKKLCAWDIRLIYQSLGSEVCSVLPFIHAIGGLTPHRDCLE